MVLVPHTPPKKSKQPEPGKSEFTAKVIFDHYQSLIYHLELKANWLIGTSSVILILVITRYDQLSKSSLSHLGILIIVIGCLSALLNLMFILVPRFRPSWKHTLALRDVNIFEYKNIQRHFSKTSFDNYLAELRTNYEEVDKVYTNAIFQMVHMRLPLNTKRLRIGGWCLLISLLLGSFFILLGLLFS